MINAKQAYQLVIDSREDHKIKVLREINELIISTAKNKSTVCRCDLKSLNEPEREYIINRLRRNGYTVEFSVNPYNSGLGDTIISWENTSPTVHTT